MRYLEVSGVLTRVGPDVSKFFSLKNSTGLASAVACDRQLNHFVHPGAGDRQRF